MIKNYLLLVLIFLFALTSCNKKETATGILQKSINTIDTVETIYYKQDLFRSNPEIIDDTIFRYREMYFERMTADSVAGVKGHWYMYVDDKENSVFEDIYDGNRLIRKNNRDSIARIYDLVKYPAFKNKHFWGHNTLYLMQCEFKFILRNLDSYLVERLNDTIIDSKHCYQVKVLLMNKMTMPGFNLKFENNEGSVSETLYYINKETYYPLRMKGVNYSAENPGQKMFIDQRYYDIKYNFIIDKAVQFNTSREELKEYEIREIQP